MQQAVDFRSECAALADILRNASESVLERSTLFKSWTINDVIGHLHMFNVAARLTLEGDGKFAAFYDPIAERITKGQSMLEAQSVWLNGLKGPELLRAWEEEWITTADLYSAADPKRRVKWAGPDMSARSSITARQMETWAHGQEIFDCLGLNRTNSDRIKNIAHLGVSTFGWTFANRGETVPEPASHVVLTAPSGAVWEWNDPQEDNRVSGSATEFCQVVTQTRNIGDTDLKITGVIAQRWMSIAQCFAGAPNEPPVPGARHIAR